MLLTRLSMILLAVYIFQVHSNRRTTSLTSQESKNDDRPTERFPLKESVDIRASQSSEYVLNTPSQSINDASSHVLGNSTRSSFQSSSGSIMSSGSRPGSNVRLTGDQKTDEDIMAFMKAREELLRKGKNDVNIFVFVLQFVLRFLRPTTS